MKRTELKHIIKDIIIQVKNSNISTVPNSKGKYEKLPNISTNNFTPIKIDKIYSDGWNSKIKVIKLDQKYVYYNIVNKDKTIDPKELKITINNFKKQYQK